MIAQIPNPDLPPLIVFEDEHLLVVHKPAGLNTHAPSPFAGEGVYDWLRHRERRWATLAIIHRLDKETSGVLMFGKTPEANSSLTEQFTRHTIRKKYLLVTDRPVGQKAFTVISTLSRSGEKYVTHPLPSGGTRAETRFQVIHSQEGRTSLLAEPVTGRTHQIRVHAADAAFPILGDTLYGGTSARRLFLHAEELILRHPDTGVEMTFRVPNDFPDTLILRLAPFPRVSGPERLPHSSLRKALIDPEMTNAYRIVHGASDGWPGWYVDRLAEFVLSQSDRPLTPEQMRCLENLLEADDCKRFPLRGAYHKLIQRRVAKGAAAEVCPRHTLGETAPERFSVRENGLQFEIRFTEGYSVGLFLDQRDNRRRFLVNHVAAGFPLSLTLLSRCEALNLFAYTCGFSVCAAKAGARTTSIDLSKKYLDWGKRDFAANQLDASKHEFLHGDAFDWLRRLAKKQRQFDVIALDPPTFSRSKEHGVFRAEKDYGKLAGAAIRLLKPAGVLFASTNAATWKAEEFLAVMAAAAHSAKRKILQQHYVPQPPDFLISREEPAYLKTLWTRLA